MSFENYTTNESKKEIINEKFREALAYWEASLKAELVWRKAIPVFPAPYSIRLAASESFLNDNIHYYPFEDGSTKLRDAVLSKFKSDDLVVSDRNIYIDYGTFEILEKIYKCLNWNVCKSIMIATPVYNHYVSQFIDNSLKYVFLETNENSGWKINPKDLDVALETHGSKVFILNNPHNPTGLFYTKSELEQLARVFKKHQVLVISDEIFKDVILVDEEKSYSIGALEGMSDSTVTINGLSKSMGLAGARISYASMPDWLVSKLPKMISGFPIPCEMAIIKALENNEENKQHREKSIEEYKKRINLIKAQINLINQELNEKHKTNLVYASLITEPRAANTVLISFKEIKGARCANGNLIENGIDLAKYIHGTANLSINPGETFHLSSEYIATRIPLAGSNLEEGFRRIKSALLSLELK